MCFTTAVLLVHGRWRAGERGIPEGVILGDASYGTDTVGFNPNSGYVPFFNANGGGGQFVYNVNKWIDGVFDMGGVTKGTLQGFNINTTVFNFVAGPRITYHNHSRFTSFAQVLFGGANRQPAHG